MKQKIKRIKQNAENHFFQFSKWLCIFLLGMAVVSALAPDKEWFISQKIYKERGRQEVYQEQADMHREAIKELQEQWKASQDIIDKYNEELGLQAE